MGTTEERALVGAAKERALAARTLGGALAAWMLWAPRPERTLWAPGPEWTLCFGMEGGIFGVGQAGGAVGEVCRGSQLGVSWGGAARYSWSGMTRLWDYLTPRAASCRLTRLESPRNSSTYLSNLRPPCHNPHSASSAVVIVVRLFCHNTQGSRNGETRSFTKLIIRVYRERRDTRTDF